MDYIWAENGQQKEEKWDAVGAPGFQAWSAPGSTPECFLLSGIVRKRATQKKSRRTSSRNCHSIISTSSCRQPGSRKSLRNRPYQKASPNQSLLIIMFSKKHTFGNFFSVLLFKLSYKQIHRSDSVKIKFQIGANICSSLN